LPSYTYIPLILEPIYPHHSSSLSPNLQEPRLWHKKPRRRAGQTVYTSDKPSIACVAGCRMGLPQ
jgi:hypothetical protein